LEKLKNEHVIEISTKLDNLKQVNVVSNWYPIDIPLKNGKKQNVIDISTKLDNLKQVTWYPTWNFRTKTKIKNVWNWYPTGIKLGRINLTM